MSATRGAWIVATSVFAVEALKDQGFCRWNYVLRTAQQRAKTKLISYYQAHRVSAMRSSSVITGKMREEKMKQTEQSLKKVMELSCWGPNTVRF